MVEIIYCRLWINRAMRTNRKRSIDLSKGIYREKEWEGKEERWGEGGERGDKRAREREGKGERREKRKREREKEKERERKGGEIIRKRWQVTQMR